MHGADVLPHPIGPAQLLVQFADTPPLQKAARLRTQSQYEPRIAAYRPRIDIRRRYQQ